MAINLMGFTYLYQSYTNHIPIIHQSYTNHTPIIYQSYTNHISNHRGIPNGGMTRLGNFMDYGASHPPFSWDFPLWTIHHGDNTLINFNGTFIIHGIFPYVLSIYGNPLIYMDIHGLNDSQRWNQDGLGWSDSESQFTVEVVVVKPPFLVLY